METCIFSKARAEYPVEQKLAEEEVIIETSRFTIIQRISNRINVSQIKGKRKFHNFNMYSYYIQSVPKLHPARIHFCRWLIKHEYLYLEIMFMDGTTFTKELRIHETSFEITKIHFKIAFYLIIGVEFLINYWAICILKSCNFRTLI